MTDWRPWLHDMRLFKSPEELAVMRRAGEISALAHTRAMEKCRHGMFEYQLEAEIHHEFTRLGARYRLTTPSSAAARTAASCTTPRTSQMRDGDLVLIDAGCSIRVRRRYYPHLPVNGKFNKPQRSVYDIVLASLLRAGIVQTRHQHP